MKYNIDFTQIKENKVSVMGWAAGQDIFDKVEYRLETRDHRKVDYEITPIRRYDVMQELFSTRENVHHGFLIVFELEQGMTYRLIFSCNGKEVVARFDPVKLAVAEGKEPTTFSKVMKLMRPQTIGKAVSYLAENGFQKFWNKTMRYVTKPDYMLWYMRVMADEEELERQRGEKFAYQPKFSIIVPVFRTEETVLKEMLDSVRKQTYRNWELCLADGSGEGSHTFDILESYTKLDERIRYRILEKNEGISGNTNKALEMATGDYIVLADHDDTLTPDALYHCAKALNRPVRPDVVYSDEDKVSFDSKRFSDPHFKPDFSPDFLRSGNYICHLFVVSKAVVDKIGEFRSVYDGAQDFDFILRCTEVANEVYHIPRILYHWRISETSTAANPDNKRYAYEAGIKAVKAHCERMGWEAKVEHGQGLGYYRTTYAVKGTPLISVIIPTKDNRKYLKKCMDSVFKYCKYPNLEFILVENNSTEPKTFEYYQELQKTYPNVKVVEWKGTNFNYSALNNFGATFAKGEYLLLLNNDIEMIEENSLEEMLSYCQREDVGVVGARLLYPDDSIQHAGVIVGMGGAAGHPFIGMDREDLSYFLRASVVQNYSAVTAACMLTKKSVFDEVGGFDEAFAVTFNDVDYCLKVRKAGKLVVYTPFATLYHHESKSRGLDNNPEKQKRLKDEAKLFEERWSDILENGDPYFNRNLNNRDPYFILKNWKDVLKENKK